MKIAPSIGNVIAVGTDGEQALVKALRAVFSAQTIHLRYFIHMKDNIQQILTDLLLPESVRKEVVFGSQQGTTYVKGILDASDEEDFYQRLSMFKGKWDSLVRPHQDPQFYCWLLKNEADEMRGFHDIFHS